MNGKPSEDEPSGGDSKPMPTGHNLARRLRRVACELSTKGVDVVHSWKMGYFCLDAERYEEAKEYFCDALRLDKSCWPALGGLGMAHLHRHEWRKAVTAFQVRLRLKPSPHHYVFLAYAYHMCHRYLDALDACSAALALEPQNCEALYNRGRALEGYGRMEEAERAFVGAVSAEPGYALGHRRLGLIYWRTGRTEEAISHLRSAIAADASDGHSHYLLARVLTDEEECTEAVTHFQIAMRILPHDHNVLHYYAQICEAMGMITEADRVYQRAMSLGVVCIATATAFAKFLENQGHCSRASELRATVDLVRGRGIKPDDEMLPD